MSVGSTSGITFSGLSSGLDINGIVTQLVNLERIPMQRYQRQQRELQSESDVYSAFKGRITSFKNSLSSLNQASTFNPLAATSSSTSVATVSATSTASAGVYDLVVKKLAQTHKISSSAQVDTVSALNLSGKFSVNGKEVSVDASDSLSAIATKINTADAKVTASVINGGTNKAYLSLTASDSGASNAITLTDGTGGVLAALGNFSTTLLAAQDAEFSLDGLNLKSSKNSVTDVVPGATINLLKANVDGSEKSTISISKDQTALKTKLKEFRDSYNSVIGFIRDNSRFNAETFQSGPLFGDATASQVESQMNSIVFSDVGEGNVKNIAQLGFTVAENGTLEFDESDFDDVIATNPTAAQSVFNAVGSGSVAGIRYVSSSTKTVAGNYAVNITAAATQTRGVASTAQTATSTGGEALTFSGSLFSGNSILVTSSGGTANDLVSQINNDSRLRDFVVASLDNDGKLQVQSKRYGAGSAFTLTSNQAAAADNSGVGTSGATMTTGVDVAGTINGEPATGNGQFLLGNIGNAKTEGLQILYSGTAVGNIGTVKFSQGLANLLDGGMEQFTDSVNGILVAADKAIQDQISDITSKMSRLSESLVSKESFLRLKFAKMEEAMGKMTSQGNQLAAISNQTRTR